MIRLEGERLAELANGCLDAHVPQYPSWKMEGLVAHTGAAFGRTAIVCRTLPQERVSSPRPEPGDDIINWYRQQLEDCLAELAHADLDTPVWAFTATPTLRFWLRRMATEAGVHRWDAGHAVGETSPLLDEVAQLGLDEVETLWMPWAGELSGLTVHATDIGRSWDYAGGGTSVVGTASDLYLRFMARPSTVGLPDDWAKAFDSLPPPPR